MAHRLRVLAEVLEGVVDGAPTRLPVLFT
jgi:hypothetical protein